MSQSIHGDDLPADLIKIIAESAIGNILPNEAGIKIADIDVTKFMESLVIYIVRRDHLVHDAGIEVGKQIANGDLEPEEEQ